MRYLLDTTFAIDYLRLRDDAIRRMRDLIERGDQPFMNDIVVCELAAGARLADERGLDALIMAVEFVQPGPNVARLAGRWRGEARARGLTLSLPDALIAATADELGAILITRNVRDFTLTSVLVEGY